MQINCANLGAEIKLSDHIRSTSEMVRVINLQPDQTFYVDVTLDGEYSNPPLPTDPKELKKVWTGKAGRKGVHQPLLSFVEGTGFTVRFADGVEVCNSQGRGVVFADCHDFDAYDVWVRGARTAGISLHDCDGFQLHQPTTIDTGNYQDEKHEGPNWPGSIKFVGCSDYSVFRPISLDHLGNGITATESISGYWSKGIAIDVRGAHYYVNASPHHSVYDAVSVGEQSAYVVNSEEENDGVSAAPEFDGCHSLGSRVGLGFWGNERKQGLVIDKAYACDCVFIYTEDGLKIHPNATINNLDTEGTIYLPQADVDTATLATLREQSATLKATILRHASNEEIDTEARKLRELFAALRPVVKPVETLYTLGQQLYIVATVTDAEKASSRVLAGGNVGGLDLQLVTTENPFARNEALTNRLQQIALMATDGV